MTMFEIGIYNARDFLQEMVLSIGGGVLITFCNLAAKYSIEICSGPEQSRDYVIGGETYRYVQLWALLKLGLCSLVISVLSTLAIVMQIHAMRRSFLPFLGIDITFLTTLACSALLGKLMYDVTTAIIYYGFYGFGLQVISVFAFYRYLRADWKKLQLLRAEHKDTKPSDYETLGAKPKTQQCTNEKDRLVGIHRSERRLRSVVIDFEVNEETRSKGGVSLDVEGCVQPELEALRQGRTCKPHGSRVRDVGFQGRKIRRPRSVDRFDTRPLF